VTGIAPRILLEIILMILFSRIPGCSRHNLGDYFIVPLPRGVDFPYHLFGDSLLLFV
jgi:hypothetical protein